MKFEIHQDVIFYMTCEKLDMVDLAYLSRQYLVWFGYFFKNHLEEFFF